MSYVKRLKKLGKDICPEGSVIRGRTARTAIKSINENCNKLEDLTGTTWKFNETLDRNIINEYPWHQGYEGDLNFTSNSKNYSCMNYEKVNKEYDQLGYYVVPSYDYIYTTLNGWDNEEYRTITITGGLYVKHGNFIKWLQANATQIK